MKINRNKGSLQNNFAKMLQAGKDNVDTNEPLRANAQEQRTGEEVAPTAEPVQQTEPKVNTDARQEARPSERQETRQSSRPAVEKEVVKEEEQKKEEQPRLNAAQRHEVPDRNTKYAGEPIKSVGCRMPQSLYARMLTYKAMNDTQTHRITLNDIIIEAVERFMDENE